MKPNDLQLSTTVDRLAVINATIKNLELEATGLKAILIASNHPSIEGDLFKAAVRFTEPGPQTDWKAVVAELNVSQATISRHTKARVPFYSVTLYGR